MSEASDDDGGLELIEELMVGSAPEVITPEMRTRFDKFPQCHEERVNVPGVDRPATYYLDPELVYRMTSLEVREPAEGCFVESIRVGDSDQLVQAVPAEVFEEKHNRYCRIQMQTAQPPVRIRIKLSGGCKELVVYGFRELRPSVRFGVE